MMESCFNTRREQVEPLGVEDLKKDLSMEFSTLPYSEDAVVDVKEHLEVYLRIRPFTTAESDSTESQDCVTMESPETVLLKPPRNSSRLSDKSVPQTGQRFHFSKVYGPETSQLDLFDGTVKDLVRHVLEGGNSLVFTYGVTNAGKTFTFLGPDGDAGLLPRSLQLVFRSVEERLSPHMAVKPHRCREFSRLTREQQAEEALAKNTLLKQLKESEKASASQLCSTSQNSSEGPSVLGSLLEDPVVLDVAPDTSFSIWVSFCEIYNENIHDLLDAGPPGAPRRAALRLSQDIKGNSFVKDLRWVQVNSAEEALKVMKLGRRNQSFAFTKLNQSSSRSHSIFSIRILRTDQAGVPRVDGISELSLCDLAGSERCAKTQNRGERLKEAGNINTSLLTLGKCINALRHNQQSKLLRHIPFRESKLTHYLQSFFCGRGRACMIVNVNQCASMYDETLNVLKFSAVAQKVVVLTSKTLPIKSQRAARDVSFLINNTDQKSLTQRRSSLMGWDSSLEDVQEEEDDDEEEESLMEDTMEEGSNGEDDEEEDKVVVCKKIYQRQVSQLKEMHAWREEQQKQSLQLEQRIREDVSSEYSALFSEMEGDYKDRLERQKDILEEKAEKRLEIFKNLVKELSSTGPGPKKQADRAACMLQDLAGIKQDTLATQTALSCLGEPSPERLGLKVQSMEQQLNKSQELLDAKTADLLQQTQISRQALESHELRLSQLMEMCREKDDIISRLQKALDEQLQDTNVAGSRKRPVEGEPEGDCQPPSKKAGSRGGAEGNPERQARSPKEGSAEPRVEEVLCELRGERRTREVVYTALEEQMMLKQEEKKRRGREGSQRSKEEQEENEEQIQERKLHIHRLEIEVVGLKQEVLGLKQEAKMASVAARAEGGCDLLREEILELKKNLLREGEEKKKTMRQMEDLEQETSQATERLVQSQREQQTRRRELLAAAEHAITEKDAELERRGLDLQRLKQQSTLDSDGVKSLEVDLQRRDEETADLREKLADSKRQIQQVHKEVASLRLEAKALTQKLTDADKLVKQLQSKVSASDRSILLLTKDHSQQTTLYQQACQDLEAQRRVVGDMRVALSEQEETQQQQEQLIQELTQELDHLKGLYENHGNTKDTPTQRLSQSELQQARQEVVQAQESLKLCTDRQQTDRKRWLEEKMLLIGQAKEAEEKRNQEMRKFAEDRERHAREHIQLESVCAELAVKEQEMGQWRRERDSLVSALEVQLLKLLSCNKEQEQLIKQLRADPGPPPETTLDSTSRSSAERTSSGSAGFPSVLESSQISTENGRRSRFPRPEMEISFSPLQPNRLALRRQGEQDSVTVKISRPRKRRSNDMDRTLVLMRSKRKAPQQDEVEVENKINTKTKLTPKQEEGPSPGGGSVTRSRKDGALLRIGDFLQSSPTLFTSGAKKVMSLVSSSSSSSVRVKKSKKKLYQPHISSPMDLPSNPIIPEEKDSDHLIIKRRLRSRTAK
ncbi:kinesin-like protein KIF20B isoform X2 [Gadus macrocephalus]|uniref:kinesin-like protein KIF20B isoform X2 n=1 Tax=Gadus macrocephalus TaxID=80720 RepID=UPI0028CB3167|nr:kinesin-like protein KIF20B isoform X2 [Gadus macrocephalus]XP_059915757.1 kinesin-like protein KIF20B isoform X2 [Gadus macrocephalus]XP_059915758.1 kinesin-like protein KIF20B isoform X2 [Gadus macrocephalus]XP_059915759.1 kinesin-like protein KIF20B isoform X2 [Gadus macrocephalus]